MVERQSDKDERAGLSREDKFTMVHNLLNRVDSLLVEAGFAQDSSIRHQLKIAKSILRDAESAAPLPECGTLSDPMLKGNCVFCGKPRIVCRQENASA